MTQPPPLPPRRTTPQARGARIRQVAPRSALPRGAPLNAEPSSRRHPSARLLWAPLRLSHATVPGTPTPIAPNVVPTHARMEQVRRGSFQPLPLPRTHADFSSSHVYNGPSTSEQPSAAPNTQRGSTPHTQRGSTSPSRAEFIAPTPAKEDDAADPLGADQSDRVKVAPLRHTAPRVTSASRPFSVRPRRHRLALLSRTATPLSRTGY